VIARAVRWDAPRSIVYAVIALVVFLLLTVGGAVVVLLWEYSHEEGPRVRGGPAGARKKDDGPSAGDGDVAVAEQGVEGLRRRRGRAASEDAQAE
jgi:hypothetical protein